MLHKKQTLVITPRNIYMPDGTVTSCGKSENVRIFPEKGHEFTAVLSLVREPPEKFMVQEVHINKKHPGFLTLMLWQGMDRDIRTGLLSCLILQAAPVPQRT